MAANVSGAPRDQYRHALPRFDGDNREIFERGAAPPYSSMNPITRLPRTRQQAARIELARQNWLRFATPTVNHPFLIG
jgi:hypothetical protein